MKFGLIETRTFIRTRWALRFIVLGDGETQITSFNQSSTIEISSWIRHLDIQCYKKKDCFFFGCFSCICFNDCLKHHLETSNQKLQFNTSRPSSFPSDANVEVHLLRSGSCSAEALKESEEAGNLLVFGREICLRFVCVFWWKSLNGEVKPCAYPSRMIFRRSWGTISIVQWHWQSSERDWYMLPQFWIVLVVYPEVQASWSY